MNKGIWFAVGLAAGCVATYILEEYRNQKRFEDYAIQLQKDLDAQYKKRASQEDKSLTELFREGDDETLMKKLNDMAQECEETPEEEDEEGDIEMLREIEYCDDIDDTEDLFEMEDYPDGFPGRPMSSYEAAILNLGYRSDPPEEVARRARTKPYVIPRNEFGTRENYTVINLTYYADNRLADDMDELILQTEYEDLIGLDALDSFGAEGQEEHIVCVRNERLKADIEVVRDVRTYIDILKEHPHLSYQFPEIDEEV